MPTRAPTHRPIRSGGTVHRVALPDDSPRLRGRPHSRRIERLSRSQPLCVACEQDGQVVVAEEWDHIVPLWAGGIEHESNLQGLCRVHHAQKTAGEAGRRAALRRERAHAVAVGMRT